MKKLSILRTRLSICIMALLAVTAGFSSAWAGPVNLNSKDYGVLSGLVYSDDNNTGIRESGEFGIPSVLIILDGLLDPIEIDDPILDYWEQLGLDIGEEDTFRTFTWTDAYGRYRFDNIPVGTYALTEITPYEFVEGKANAVGSLGGEVVTNNQFADIAVAPGDIGVDYNFGEWGLKIGYISKRALIVPEPSIATLFLGMVAIGACLRRRR
ncbi:MAG: hypothetical protein JXM70_11895 [Pirellulales bacterium]|nr:hypothetical protein [Pirellulales bacterium]